MAFMCPIRIGRSSKKKRDRQGEKPAAPAIGRITGSASIETLVRVGLEKEHGLGPNSEVVVLHDFTPCVDDEIGVKRGDIVHTLYQENDWVYVISGSREGFIPQSYCAPVGSPLAEMALSISKKKPRERSSDDHHQQSSLESSIVHSDIESVDTPSCYTDVHPFFKDSAGRFLVLYSFIARDENDISVERGELVTVLNREDADWFWVQRYNGHEGFVPSAFIFPADVINSHAQSPETSSEAQSSAPAPATLRQEATSQKPLLTKQDDDVLLDNIDFKDMTSEGGGLVGGATCAAQKEYRYDTKSGTVSLHTYHNTMDRACTTGRNASGGEQLPSNNLNRSNNNATASQRADGGVEGTTNSGSLKTSGYRDNGGGSNTNSSNNRKSVISHTTQDRGNSSAGRKMQDHNVSCISQAKDDSDTGRNGSSKQLDSAGKENEQKNGGEPYRAKATELVVLYDHDTVAEYELPIKRKELVYADLNCQNAEGWYWVYSPRLNEYGYVPRGFVIAAQPATTSL
ncbi:SH3 domain-containing protein 19-like [Tropilaelaps mercedesae]|uniref:SH3 domain-containing protein 19-like n=1 Tax=Tropilaelaps mercedesae TaxID=418985 RepID=A0A1V9X1D7_9ACAR|nr:SH3 domain-containing protein 19-like [Tropilaelaps mercedesae]